jgi:hypothetical protein
MRQIIINSILGGIWGYLLVSLGAGLATIEYWVGIIVLLLLIINSMID